MKPTRKNKDFKKSDRQKNRAEEPPQIEEVTGEHLAQQQDKSEQLGESREHRGMDRRHNDFSGYSDETVGERKAREEQKEEPDDKGL